MTSRMTADPDPVDAGKKTKICYSFDKAPALPASVTQVTLSLAYVDAPNETLVIQRGETDPSCKEITIPDSATALTITDESGHSEQLAVGIEIPPAPPG